MRRRKRGLGHWVVVPALASVGITLVAYGQNLVAEDVSLAAPVAAIDAAAAAARGGQSAAASPSAQTNPEFGGPPAATGQPVPSSGRIPSTTQDQLIRRARESAGREDPFVSLLLPQAITIVPVFIPPPPSRASGVSAPPVRINPVTGRRMIFQNGQWIEETITINPDEPRWTVQGILNTGRESLVILELDGVTREAHIGEVLEDGSKVVAISGSQVTLLAAGRRYVKTIGGLDLQ